MYIIHNNFEHIPNSIEVYDAYGYNLLGVISAPHPRKLINGSKLQIPLKMQAHWGVQFDDDGKFNMKEHSMTAPLAPFIEMTVADFYFVGGGVKKTLLCTHKDWAKYVEDQTKFGNHNNGATQ